VRKTKMTDWARQSGGETLVDQARADLLERLYFWDGRDDREHPLHHTYTGLYQKYNAER
jgi:hypothetical protein